VTQTLENGECVDAPVPIIECEPGFVLNEDGDACEPVAQTPANTTTPTPTSTSTPRKPFQGVMAIPDPDCIAGRSVDNIPACEDPSIAQFAKTCESVAREGGGGGFENHCIVDRNACANADFQLVYGVCQARPPVGYNTTFVPKSQYDCMAEQTSPRLPTCGTDVGNDPNYVCFPGVGETICSRGGFYDPCTDNSKSFACGNKIKFCNANPNDRQCQVRATIPR
jgi:hypothetical protein